MKPANALPEPGPDARRHSAALEAVIRERITAAGGWIDFAEYMGLALYAPELGYYRGGSQKFGGTGDFVTAPELSPIFARCLARPVAELLQRSGGDTVLEFGAGTGALAAELIAALDAEGCAPRRYLVMELSGELRARQQARVRDALGTRAAGVEWLDRLPAEPLRGAIIANEVLDALPVNRFVVGADAAAGLGVGLEAGRLVERRGPLDPAAAALLDELAAAGRRLPPGYRGECCPTLAGWVAAAARCLERGAIVLADYGLPRAEYYHPDRADGTFACFYRHRVHGDPLRWPGLQDLSAWVDFSLVAAAGRSAGLELAGFGTQAHFLLANGVDAALGSVAGARTPGGLAALGAAQRLLMPGEMGERIKLMALARGVPGFRLALMRDLADRLGGVLAVA